MESVADQFAAILAAAGVKRIYGIVGDSLDGLTDAIRRQGKIEWLHMRHEEVAALAAGAEAHLTGDLAVCAGSCRPGNLHLINGLFDCRRSRAPRLAIAARIRWAEIGTAYFQETHPQTLFQECSRHCKLVSSSNQMPRLLEIAIREAVERRGVSMMAIPGDVALQDATDALQPGVAGLLPSQPVETPARADLERLAGLFNTHRRITLPCGSGCTDAHDALLALAESLKAPMVHALRGKEHVEWDNPYDAGMTGLIGFASGCYVIGNRYRACTQGSRAHRCDGEPGRARHAAIGHLGDGQRTLALHVENDHERARRRSDRPRARTSGARTWHRYRYGKYMTIANIGLGTLTGGPRAHASRFDACITLDTSASALMRVRLRASRSFLLTPGSRPERFADARAGDAIVVDLESAVAAADKGRAREAALAFLRQPAVTDFSRLLRINNPLSLEGLRDLRALDESGARPDAIVIAKCQSADDVGLAAELLGASKSDIGLVPMVDPARAPFVADRIVNAHPRVCALFLDAGDLATDPDAERSQNNLLHGRSRIVAAAAAAGIAAIDVPYLNGDVAGLTSEASASRNLGMTGKAALHAQQLETINAIFAPSAYAVTHASAVMAAVATSAADAPALDGHLVEPAMVREAERVLLIARVLRKRSRVDAAKRASTSMQVLKDAVAGTFESCGVLVQGVWPTSINERCRHEDDS